MSEQVPHRVDRDSRGWFCLNCSWPGVDFTIWLQDALDHQENSRAEVP